MADLITCKNCGNRFSGKFCNQCGEKVYTEKDKSVLHFFEEGIHFITHFEGTFFTSLKAILTKPGLLSTDYCNGTRKKYFKPLSFFLVIVVVYLLFPVFSGLNMPMRSYGNERFLGHFAKHRIEHLVQARHLTSVQL